MRSPDANGRPTAVVFDLGGVLLDWNPRYLYRKLFDDEAEMDRFLSEVCTMEWHHAHDLGVPPEETCPPLIAAHPEYAEMIWAWPQRSAPVPTCFVPRRKTPGSARLSGDAQEMPGAYRPAALPDSRSSPARDFQTDFLASVYCRHGRGYSASAPIAPEMPVP